MEFTCTAENTEDISYRVNNSLTSDLQDNSFMQVGSGAESLGGSVRRRNLTVAVSSLFNNTEIFCRAIGKGDFGNVNSKMANLTVQGMLFTLYIF